MEKQTIDFIKNLKLTVNRFHLRFEDDYFSKDSPYAFGLVFDVSFLPFNSQKLVWESSDK